MTKGPWEYISLLPQHSSWIMNLQSSFMDSMDPLIIGGGWKFLFYQPIESKVRSLLWWTNDSTSWMKLTPFKDPRKLKVVCRQLTTSKMVGYKTKLWKSGEVIWPVNLIFCITSSGSNVWNRYERKPHPAPPTFKLELESQESSCFILWKSRETMEVMHWKRNGSDGYVAYAMNVTCP